MMTKIGGGDKSTRSSSSGEKPGLRGTGKISSSLGSTSPPDQAPAHERGKCLDQLWKLKTYLSDHFAHHGAGYSGSFNIETSTFEIKGEVFSGCQHPEDLSADCNECGRKTGNNIAVLSGRGDGVYSGINYWAGSHWEEGEPNPELLASLYLFDENNAHAVGFVRSGWAAAERHFFSSAAEYQNLPGSVVGDIQAGDGGFFVGDLFAGPGTNDALVNHWGSEGRKYRVIAFYELVDPSKVTGPPVLGADGNQSLPMRPRVVMIVGEKIADELFGDDSGLEKIDWAQQPALWRNMLVAANIGGGGNAVACINNDGLYWLNVMRADLESTGRIDNVTRSYQIQALGLFLQGALLGDSSCRAQAQEILTGAHAAGLDEGSVAFALSARGWPYDDRATELVASLRG